MDLIDKIQFSFCAYDFTESGSLGSEEISLLLRSAVKGLSKVTNTNEVSNMEIDRITELIFDFN